MVLRDRCRFSVLAWLFLVAAVAAAGVPSCKQAGSARTFQELSTAARESVQPPNGAEITEEVAGENLQLSAAEAAAAGSGKAEAMQEPKLPRLVEFGFNNCLPCRQMMPVLGGLAKDYKGELVVEVVQVYEETDRARAAGIRLIPTQVFYSPEGKELARHEGFMSRDDILAEWKRLGYDFGQPREGA